MSASDDSPGRFASTALRLGLLSGEGVERILAELSADTVGGERADRATEADPGPSGGSGTARAGSSPGAWIERGTHLGRHALEGRLGAGGMGDVFLVRDIDMHRAVAAKLMRATADPTREQRFVAEAQLTGQLEHPNIVPVHQLGWTDDGRPYFTMKQVRGHTLEEVLLGGPTPGASSTGSGVRTAHNLPRHLQLFVKVCDAVAYAHSKNVIHRDLKPANIMVGKFGEVLVMDWGLARVLGEVDATGDSLKLHVDSSDEHTDPGAILGTPAYMSPEQARGDIEHLNARTDIYALGAILYTLLTGKRPYEGETAWAIIAQVGEGGLVPPSERTSAPIPWELEAVVMKAMALYPEDRYTDVRQLQADVEAYLAGRLLAAAEYSGWQRVVKRVQRHKTVVVAGLAALLIALGLLGAQRWQRLRELDAEVVAARASVREHQQASRELVAAWRRRLAERRPGDAVRPEPPDERTRRRAAIASYLQAISRLDRVLAGRPTHAEARALRRGAGHALGELALVGGDDALAVWSFRQLDAHGGSRAEVERLVGEVARLRSQRERERAARLTSIVEDLEAGLSRPGRSLDLPTLDEYLSELVAMREPATAVRLGQALSSLSERARAEGGATPWSLRDRELATLVCRVLGRLGLPESIPPLAGWAGVVKDRRLAVIAGHALCDTRQAAAYAPLLALRERLGPNSEAWEQIRRRLGRVPEPPTRGELTVRQLERRGMIRLAQGNLEGGLADFDRAIERDPRRAPTYTQRGVAWRRLGDRRKALADLTRSIELDPSGVVPHFNRAQVHRELEDYPAALADLTRALELDVAYAPAYIARAQVWVKSGRLDRAKVDADEAVRLESSADAYQLRATIRRQQSDFEGALADLTAAIGIDPNAPRYHDRASLRLRLGDRRGALRDFDTAVRLRPGHGQTFANRGLVKSQLGDIGGALRDFEKAIELSPEAPLAFAYRASVRLKSGDVAGALADANRAVKRGPDQVDGYEVRARVHLVRRDPAAARADYDRAIKVAPKDPTGWLGRGRVNVQSGDPKAALRDYDRAAELDPHDPHAFFFRANLHMRQGRPDACLADLERAIRAGPTFAPALIGRGLLRKDRGDIQGAVADLERATRADGRSWVAWANFGRVLTAAGRREDALRAYRKALPLASPPIQKKLERDIRKLEADGG